MISINVNSLRQILHYLPKPTEGAVHVIKMRDRLDDIDMHAPPDYSDDSLTSPKKTLNYREMVFKSVRYCNVGYDGSTVYEWELQI